MLTLLHSHYRSMNETYKIRAKDLVVQQPNKVGITPNWVMSYTLRNDIFRLESNLRTESVPSIVTIQIDSSQLQYLISTIRAVHNNQRLSYELGTHVILVDSQV
ncbi:hypothetical protein CLV81_2809 [Flagellimonas meridianipacifica]|uniref:Uncharacterized protein n=1 Tax=Flagellimonas meridianipacifica TaxID=1080225 RepID=A0A2T0MAA1_9FLAO|nr:hypothetical protein CLV81_2809 [Allomuricauda pacifica]